MTDWDLLFTDLRIATMQPDEPGYGIVENAALALADGVIAWVGPMREQPEARIAETRSLHGRWLTPALIDCHTHLVFGGDRAHEFEQRLQGVSYEAIARAGGGILSTVRATREASHEQLFDAAMPRVRKLMASGVATVEIKSGYGLDVETEIKMLEVAKRIEKASDVSVRTPLSRVTTVS